MEKLIGKTTLEENNVDVNQNLGVATSVNNGVIINGMNYTEVKALCLDLIKDEINKTKAEALIEAQKRDSDLIMATFEKLGQAGFSAGHVREAFNEPAMQIDFIEAEKSYIKYGTEELKNILSEILAKRISNVDHSLLQISLGEAIKTAPLLLPSQMATLALFFVVCHTRNFHVISHSTFAEYLQNYIIPIFQSGLSSKQSEFQHLSYARCATMSIASSSLVSILVDKYGGLFAKGFDLSSIPNSETGEPLHEKYPSLFLVCLNDSAKYQVNAINKEALDTTMDKLHCMDEDKTKIKKLYSDYLMNASQAEKKIIELCPEMDEVIKYWNTCSIKHLNLSSVGIVIGALYASSKINTSFDLNIWIE